MDGSGRMVWGWFKGFPGGSDSKDSACNVEDLGLIPGLGRSPGWGHGYPLQYSCLENSMDRGAWWATLHGVAMSQTRLKQLALHTHITFIVHFIFLLLLHQLHLRSSDIRSRRLGTPALNGLLYFWPLFSQHRRALFCGYHPQTTRNRHCSQGPHLLVLGITSQETHCGWISDSPHYSPSRGLTAAPCVPLLAVSRLWGEHVVVRKLEALFKARKRKSTPKSGSWRKENSTAAGRLWLCRVFFCFSAAEAITCNGPSVAASQRLGSWLTWREAKGG